MSNTLWLVVPAAGQGRRMGADKPKQYLTLNNQPILALTLARLHAAFPQARLVLCLDSDDRWFDPTWVPFAQWQRVLPASGWCEVGLRPGAEERCCVFWPPRGSEGLRKQRS